MQADTDTERQTDRQTDTETNNNLEMMRDERLQQTHSKTSTHAPRLDCMLCLSVSVCLCLRVSVDRQCRDSTSSENDNS